MSYDDYSLDVAFFINQVLEPSESFARLFQNAHIDAMTNHGMDVEIKANFNDVGEVSGALTSLTRFRLQQFAEKLEERVGSVQVMQHRKDIAVDYEVCGVKVEMEEHLKNIQAEQEK